MNLLRLTCSLGGLIAAGLLAGCASSGVKNPSGVPVTEMNPDERGFVAGTGIESQDIVTVADKMARQLLAVPEIANATSTPRVILDPVRNDTRFRINERIFLEEIMALLKLSNQRYHQTLIVVTHDRDIALQADRIISFGDGRIMRDEAVRA